MNNENNSSENKEPTEQEDTSANFKK